VSGLRWRLPPEPRRFHPVVRIGCAVCDCPARTPPGPAVRTQLERSAYKDSSTTPEDMRRAPASLARRFSSLKKKYPRITLTIMPLLFTAMT
jgi:hypothetical protein